MLNFIRYRRVKGIILGYRFLLILLLLGTFASGCAQEQEAQQESVSPQEQTRVQHTTTTTSKSMNTTTEVESNRPTSTPLDETTQATQAVTTPLGETTQADVLGEEISADIPTVKLGESVSLGPFDFRVLDFTSTDHYTYVEATYPSIEEVDMVDTFPQVGKFVVVTYVVENTTNTPIDPEGVSTLVTATPEFYEIAEDVSHPPTVYGDRTLQPRQTRVGQLIFDVPQDVEPSRLDVYATDESMEPINQGAEVDLSAEAPEEIPPEDILALQYEYVTMAAFDEAYALFADQSQQLVSPEQYKAFFENVGPYGTKNYSFPSVQVQGDTATVNVVFTAFSMVSEEEQFQRTQQMVLEDEGWRIVMRDEQVSAFTGS